MSEKILVTPAKQQLFPEGRFLRVAIKEVKQVKTGDGCDKIIVSFAHKDYGNLNYFYSLEERNRFRIFQLITACFEDFDCNSGEPFDVSELVGIRLFIKIKPKTVSGRTYQNIVQYKLHKTESEG